MGTPAKDRDWTNHLPLQRRRRKQISLGDAAKLSTLREIEGWFVAAVNTTWRIGRKSIAGHFELVSDNEPVTFNSVLAAETYLTALLQPPR